MYSTKLFIAAILLALVLAWSLTFDMLYFPKILQQLDITNNSTANINATTSSSRGSFVGLEKPDKNGSAGTGLKRATSSNSMLQPSDENRSTKNTQAKIPLENSASDTTLVASEARKSKLCSLRPDKYLRATILPNLMYPEEYESINGNPTSVGDFPVCKDENRTCDLGVNGAKVLNEYFERQQSPEIQALQRPNQDPFPTIVQEDGSITVRVLMGAPEWWHRSESNRPRWEAIRTDCMGISCDARFGSLDPSINESHVKVMFDQDPPRDAHVQQWKPHIYMQRVTIGNYAKIAKMMWANHSVAFGLQTGESCFGKGCQFGKGALFASPGTILNALTQGDVMSLATGKDSLLKVLESPPRNLSSYGTEAYYSGLFVSNCGDAPTRTRWLKALMNEIPIASYGACPRRTPGKSCPRNSQCSKIKESSKYPFHIAIENTPMLPGYITEKPWQAFESNTLPVLWSTPDIDALLPSHSYIDIRQFISPKALAEYLRKVRSDEALYNSYFDWRRDPDQMAKFKRQVEPFAYGGQQQICGMCHAYLQKFVIPNHCGANAVAL